jgi:hypothetical protein
VDSGFIKDGFLGKMGSSGVKEPHHIGTSGFFDKKRPRFHRAATSFFAVEDKTSCDLHVILEEYLLTFYFQYSHEMVQKLKKKNPEAVALGRLGGMKGGKARAKKLSAKLRSEIAKKASSARMIKISAKRRKEIGRNAIMARWNKRK